MMDAHLLARLGRVQRLALALGGGLLASCLWGVFFNRPQFFFSYLFAYLFWLGLSLGCLVVSMIHQLTGGRWGYPTRRIFEAGSLVLPLMIALFVPLCFGLHELYPWARPATVAADKTLQLRQAYSNGPGFILRAGVCLAVWLWMAASLRRWSRAQDSTGDAAPTRKARALSGIGLVIYSLLASVAFIDWILSLETRWYSTLFAVIVIIGQILAACAFGVLLILLLRNSPPLAGVLSPTHLHHLGNLLLTFVLFWTYISFGQLLIIYSGDLPHELDWYLHRIAGNWRLVVGALALFHFFAPFFLLLFRPVKRHPLPLGILAGLLFVAHIADTYWLVMPALHQKGIQPSWLDLSSFLGIGGLWLAGFLARLKAAPLLPQQDPGMQFAFTYET